MRLNEKFRWMPAAEDVRALLLPWAFFTVCFAIDKAAFTDLVHCPFTAGQVMCILVTSAFWSLLALVPFPLLGRRARFVYLPLAVLLVTSDALQWHCRLNHDMILNGNLVGIFFASSWQEIQTYLECLSMSGLALCLGAYAIVVAFLVVAFLKIPVNRVSSKSATLSGAMLLVALSFFAVKDRALLATPANWLRQSLVCGNCVMGCVDGIRTSIALRRILRSPTIGGMPRTTASARSVGVFVLGESATRSRWSLYGYSRRTTPCMDALSGELVAFSNAVAAANTTAEVMRLMLTEATVERPADMRCALPQVLSAAGCECVLFSAQQRWDEYDGIEPYAFAGCSEMRWLSEEIAGREWYDDALLDFLDRKLAEPREKPLVVFLHLRGSHFPPSFHYPPGTGPFPGERVSGDERVRPALNVNNYDNTIAFTDKVLGGVVERLKRVGGPTWMLYVSDHGESVCARRFRTDTDSCLMEVPMVLWTSSEYRESHGALLEAARSVTGAALRNDLLFPTVLRLCDVDGYEGARFEAEPFGRLNANVQEGQ